MKRVRFVLLVAAVTLLGGALLGGGQCGGQEVIVGCQDDTDCGASQTCNVASGVCLCADDGACDASEFCNLAGRCQTKTECLNNTDCGAFPEICDTSRTDDNAGQCLALDAQSTQCVLDSHCPFGFYCQDRICQLGCRENGDCTLGQPCIAGQCDTRRRVQRARLLRLRRNL